MLAKKEWVNEWLLFNANLRNLSLYHGENKLYFQWDDEEVRFVLDQHSELDIHSASSLKQQSADRNVVPLGQIILIPSKTSLSSLSLMLRA